MAAANTGHQLLLCASQLGLGVFELLWGPSCGAGVVVWFLLSQSAEVWVGQTVSLVPLQVGPAFLYKSGFLIKSTHCKRPLGLGFL